MLKSSHRPFDLEVVFQAILASGQQQNLDVDESLECLALEVARGIFGKKPRSRAFDAVARDVDVADAGEDIWVRRGFGRRTGEGYSSEQKKKKTQQRGLLVEILSIPTNILAP